MRKKLVSICVCSLLCAAFACVPMAGCSSGTEMTDDDVVNLRTAIVNASEYSGSLTVKSTVKYSNSFEGSTSTAEITTEATYDSDTGSVGIAVTEKAKEDSETTLNRSFTTYITSSGVYQKVTDKLDSSNSGKKTVDSLDTVYWAVYGVMYASYMSTFTTWFNADKFSTVDNFMSYLNYHVYSTYYSSSGDETVTVKGDSAGGSATYTYNYLYDAKADEPDYSKVVYSMQVKDNQIVRCRNEATSKRYYSNADSTNVNEYSSDIQITYSYDGSIPDDFSSWTDDIATAYFTYTEAIGY